MTVETLLVALQSMLASATHRERPPDDAMFVRRVGKDGEKVNVEKLSWSFHDSNC